MTAIERTEVTWNPVTSCRTWDRMPGQAALAAEARA
jgi:protein gp37